ncbi:Heat shock factor-binding protein-like protein [Drosera capensis]
MDGYDGDDSKQSTADMTVFGYLHFILLNPWYTLLPLVLLNLVGPKSSSADEAPCFLDCDSLDEMGTRIDELEQSINELRAEMGTEGSPSPSITPIPKADDSKTEADSG